MRRNAFTLVELVVVVLILGIIAAIAAPRVLSTSTNAKENATRQNLLIFREAIAHWKAEKGSYPNGASDYVELVSRLRGNRMLECLVGSGQSQNVEVVADGVSLFGTGGDGSAGTKMWKYDSQTGQVIINYHAPSSSGEMYDEW